MSAGGALVLALGSTMTVSHRVINPLHAIRDAMLKVAAGDLSVDPGYAERRDEIGALAGALGVFKQHTIEKDRIEQQERDRNLGAAARQRAIAGAAALNVKSAAGVLGSQAQRLRGQVDEFLGKIRAA